MVRMRRKSRLDKDALAALLGDPKESLRRTRSGPDLPAWSVRDMDSATGRLAEDWMADPWKLEWLEEPYHGEPDIRAWCRRAMQQYVLMIALGSKDVYIEARQWKGRFTEEQLRKVEHDALAGLRRATVLPPLKVWTGLLSISRLGENGRLMRMASGIPEVD